MIRINFTKKDINELEHERFHYPVPRIQRKIEAIYLKSQNVKHGTICKLCRISNVTLLQYMREYIEGGIDRLKLNLFKGKANLLSSHQETLEDYFYTNPPRSAAEARKIIEEKTEISRCLTQVREFLKRIGLKYRKVGSVPGKVTTEEKIKEQENFIEKELTPRIIEAENGKRDFFLWMPPILSTKHT